MEMLYKTTTLKNLPMHNVFNRTCIFEPVVKNNQSLFRKREYSDTVYKVLIEGCYLNCSVDYPLFAILIAQYINNVVDEVDNPIIATIPLSKIVDSIGVSGTGNRDANFKKIYDSLARLENTKISYTNQISKKVVEGTLINSSDLDFKNKSLTVNFTRLIFDLYDLKSIKESEVNYMNIQQLTEIDTEGGKALYKFLVTQSKGYIDFTFKRLSMVLGYHYRMVAGKRKAKPEEKKIPLKDSKKREYIIEALNTLKRNGIISDFHYYEKLGHYRMLQTEYYPDIAQDIDIHKLKSNINQIKQIKFKKSKSAQDDDFPFDPKNN